MFLVWGSPAVAKNFGNNSKHLEFVFCLEVVCTYTSSQIYVSGPRKCYKGNGKTKKQQHWC